VDYRTLNPATGELVEMFETLTEKDLECAIDAAAGAYTSWHRTPLGERCAALQRAGDLLENHADELADVMALEMGKPVAQGKAEAAKCALVCRHYAEHAEAMLAPESRESGASRSFVRHDPLGPILAIMPWNFPFWQFFRFAAPALAAGNVVLLKHAPNTPRCGLDIERLLREAAFPEHVVQNLFISHEQAAGVISDPRVRGVTLTGSTRAGRDVAATAGRHLKKMVMELGGSDPFIVFDDADLEQAVEVGVAARCQNSGQSCIAAKRFLVQEPVYDRFLDAFVEAMRGQTVGPPQDETTDIGPLARRDLRNRLVDQVNETVWKGARVLTGGSAPESPGFYYPPTVLEEVDARSPAATQELFGPVASLFPFTDEMDAAVIAGRTSYGLAASIWTHDAERIYHLIPELEFGSVFVNGQVKSDPRLPFGGVKESGFGRELGREGMLEFVNAKTVWVR